MSENGSEIPPTNGGELPKGALPEEAGEQMGDPSGKETKALGAADEASASAGLMIEETGSAGPRGAGARTEGQAQPGASADGKHEVEPTIEDGAPGAGEPEADGKEGTEDGLGDERRGKKIS